MTSAEVQELKEFITQGLGQVRGEIAEGLGQVRGEIAEFRAEHRDFQAHVAKRFGRVYGRLGAVEGRLGSVEGRLGSVEGRLGSVEEGQVSMNERLRRVEVGQEEMRHDFKAAFEQVSETNRRVDGLESKVERGFSELREEMRFGFRTWGKRVEAVEAHLGMDGGAGEGDG